MEQLAYLGFILFASIAFISFGAAIWFEGLRDMFWNL